VVSELQSGNETFAQLVELTKVLCAPVRKALLKKLRLGASLSLCGVRSFQWTLAKMMPRDACVDKLNVETQWPASV
jgi:hypothetical protein